MYTTNIIEGFHRQLRTVTKYKGAFQSEDALMKLQFPVQETIGANWNKPVHKWTNESDTLLEYTRTLAPK
jgi:putative transposase